MIKILTFSLALCGVLLAPHTIVHAATVSVDARGLQITSQDETFAVRIGGRLHADYGVLKDSADDSQHASRIRNARLGMQGHIDYDWHYKLEFDFAGNQANATDLFISYHGFEPVNITLGRHKMPSGLEALTGIGNISFMERSLASNLFSAGRQNGLSLTGGGSHWSWSTASWLGDVQQSHQSSEHGVGGRLTYAPYSQNDKHLHFGLSSYHQHYGKNGSAGYRDQQISSAPEISIASASLFQAQLDAVKNTRTYGLESAYIHGAWSAQSEWFQQQVNTAGKIRHQNGWALSGSYLITGESRQYHANTGRIGGIRPARAVNDGGIGAWELVLRYSDVSLQAYEASNTTRNKGELWTIGMNWYASPSVRFMANYNHVDIGKSAQPSQTLQAVQLRGQIVF